MFVRKTLMIAVSSLVLVGCGSSDQAASNSTAVGPAFSPSLQLLRLTAQNANDAANTLTGLEAQTTSLITGPVDGSNGTPMGVIQNLLLAYPRLSLPQPPSDTLQVSGRAYGGRRPGGLGADPGQRRHLAERPAGSRSQPLALATSVCYHGGIWASDQIQEANSGARRASTSSIRAGGTDSTRRACRAARSSDRG